MAVAACWAVTVSAAAQEAPFSISGVYPHLAMFNGSDECGTGAVVPWAGRLWVVTYSPHAPLGSDDKLYAIDAGLSRMTHPDSVGGTPASRMIHDETGQLFIGPYVIDRDGAVRVLGPDVMPGRLTGTARHLVEPADKVYFATMEEGFYEVDARTLEVRELYPDSGVAGDTAGPLLPGYHGKGLFTGQGRLVYANNGEHSQQARIDPRTESGCLAEWDGVEWTVVRRNQFTEVSGPGGIRGSGDADGAPIWSVGWDHRSLLLAVRDGGAWHFYRLPKASHAYDGAHGWNTEWPRIRDIGEDDLLMTMHGMFWRFPKAFAPGRSRGIEPRSSYLKVIGDFCRWNGHVVLGCNDTARSEFLNTRAVKGELAGPGISHSNLRFILPEDLDGNGPPLGRGAVWMNDDVAAAVRSDPYLFSGFDRRGVHLAHRSDHPVEFAFEVDRRGTGEWKALRSVRVPASGYRWVPFQEDEQGAWIRAYTDVDCVGATVGFQYAAADPRSGDPDPIFAGLARRADAEATGGWIRSGGGEGKPHVLQFAARAARQGRAEDLGYYELDEGMALAHLDAPDTFAWLNDHMTAPQGIVTVDAASVVYDAGDGQRYRLPKGDPAFDVDGPLGPARVAREVVTERDLLNAHGTFYELPAENAGGFRFIRPVTTHNRAVSDFCSWRGLLILSGVAADAPADNPHILRSQDGRCALWIGEVDDLWRAGKPVGTGGPWKDTAVRKDQPSDPYLMTGYDRKRVDLSHDAPETVRMVLEVDAVGEEWFEYAAFDVPPGEVVTHAFPEGFNAYWVRLRADRDCAATAWFTYE